MRGTPSVSSGGMRQITFAHNLAIRHTDSAIRNHTRIVVQQSLCGGELCCRQYRRPQILRCQAGKESLGIEG